MFKRHRRDSHDFTTVSTSPNPKRRRKTGENNDNEMLHSDFIERDMNDDDLTKSGEVDAEKRRKEINDRVIEEKEKFRLRRKR